MNGELLEFVNQLTEWHSEKVANLKTIAEMTGPFTLKVGDDVETELTAREAALFRAGMEAVLMEIGKLPFSVTTNADEGNEGLEP